MIEFGLLLFICIIVLLVWNAVTLYRHHKRNDNPDKQYYELNAKLNFIIAMSSVLLFIAAFLGWNTKDSVYRIMNNRVDALIKQKNKVVDSSYHQIDSVIKSKDILKAGIYIVTDQEFKEDRVYKFSDFKTIDNKRLPLFSNPPKLVIITNTGENLRIKQETSTYFVLGMPITKLIGLAIEGDNPNYPKVVKFDMWIADYKKS